MWTNTDDPLFCGRKFLFQVPHETLLNISLGEENRDEFKPSYPTLTECFLFQFVNDFLKCRGCGYSKNNDEMNPTKLKRISLASN